MKNRNIKYLLLSVIIVLVMNMGFVSATALPIDETKNILIINAYHYDLSWTEASTRAEINAIRKEYTGKTRFFVEYMDWKEYPTDEQVKLFYNEIKYKYEGRKIDVIIASDDAAVSFAIKHQNDIFKDAPIVFQGISEESYSNLLKNTSNITGIIEEVDILETVKLAMTLNPMMKKFYVIYDQTESGKTMGKTAIQEIEKNSDFVETVAISDMSIEEILNYVKNIDETDNILITAYYTDINGENINFEDMIKAVSDASRAPVFSLYDFGIENGSIGGTMLSGTLQGERAADLTVKILNGLNAKDLSIVRDNIHKTIVDYNEAIKYNIDLKKVNPEIEIVNKPISIFTIYAVYIYMALGIMFLLTIFLIILTYYLRKTWKLKNELLKKNIEQKSLNDELAASEEELKAQFDSLQELNENLQSSYEKNKLMLGAIKDIIIDWNITDNEAIISSKWTEAIGYTPEEIKTVDFIFKLVHPQEAVQIQAIFCKTRIDQPKDYSIQCRLKTKSGLYKWFLVRSVLKNDQLGNPKRMITSFTDIDEIKNMEDQLLFSAFHDELTKLPNKRALTRDFNIYLLLGSKPVSILLIDIDHFKRINDTMGHSFGDKYIIEVGKKIASEIGENCDLYRIGGDEFIIFCKDHSKEELECFAEKLVEKLNCVVSVEFSNFSNTISMGVALYPEDGESIETLLTKADLAMYFSKENGRSRFKLFNEFLYDKIVWHMERENLLKSALENNEFTLAYQAQVDCKNHDIVGFEALIRWNNPILGHVPPTEFIPIAEENQLIIPIGKWVIEEACRFIKKINAMTSKRYHISVNVSVIQLIQEDFETDLLNTIRSYGLTTDIFEIEITETVLIQVIAQSVTKLNKLKEMGIRIALDDFGKGYSSLSYLKELPLTTLKIDKTFIDALGDHSEQNDLVHIIIEMGHQMNLRMVAEGVETIEQLNQLQNRNCDIIQGYYFSKPINETETIKFIKESAKICEKRGDE